MMGLSAKAVEGNAATMDVTIALMACVRLKHVLTAFIVASGLRVSSELAEEVPDILILPARPLTWVRRVWRVGPVERAKRYRVPGHATHHVRADVVAARHLRGRHEGAAVCDGEILGQRYAIADLTSGCTRFVVAEDGIGRSVRRIIGDRLGGRAVATQLRARVNGNGADVSVRRSAEGSLA